MFIQSLNEYLKERASSTIIFSFIIFYIICNCRWIFATLFVDQNLILEKYGMLKNEYIYQNFVELHPDDLWFWLCSIVAPIVLTYLYIWWAPKIITNPAYKVQLRFKNERRKFKYEEESKLQTAKNSAIKSETKNTNALIELQDKKAELKEKNPQQVIEEEFKDFQQNSEWTDALLALRHIIYGNLGSIPPDMDSDLIMILDVNGLTCQDDFSAQHLSITDKGKEFLRLASNANGI